MIKCAIFDLDGTLVKSMEYWSLTPIKYLELNNITINNPKEISDKFLSMSLYESALWFIDEYKINKSVDEVMQGIDDVMEYYYMNYVEIKEGIEKILELLFSHNVKMAIATATDKYLVKKVISKLNIDKYFSYIITSGEVGSSKQKPDIYLRCAEFFNANPTESIIFEDLPYGIISSKKVGFHTVGIYDEPSAHHQDKIKENAEFYFKEINDDSIASISNLLNPIKS